jgi:hypothetical protein
MCALSYFLKSYFEKNIIYDIGIAIIILPILSVYLKHIFNDIDDADIVENMSRSKPLTSYEELIIYLKNYYLYDIVLIIFTFTLMNIWEQTTCLIIIIIILLAIIDYYKYYLKKHEQKYLCTLIDDPEMCWYPTREKYF